MKKVLCILFSVVISTLCLCSCESADSSDTYDIYFLDAAKTSVSIEKRNIDFSESEKNDPAEFGKKMLDEIMKGPVDTIDFARAISEDTTINYVQVITEPEVLTVPAPMLIVDFSDKFINEDAYLTNMAAYTIVNTLCKTGVINSVCIRVNGENFFGEDKFPMGAVILSDYTGFDAAETKPAAITTTSNVIYFMPDSDGCLQRTEATVENHTNETPELLALSQLMNALSEKSMISSDAKIVSGEIKEGVFYLNLSSAFYTKATGQTMTDTMVIEAITTTLTEFETIDKVQFLSDGEKIEHFGEMSGFDTPLSRNETLQIKE